MPYQKCNRPNVTYMYTFNTNLKVGDILLVRGAKMHSKMIAKMTNGFYSHAMITLENGVFLEAITGSGVQLTSGRRVSFKSLSNVVVLRCIFPDEQTQTNILTYISRNFPKYQGRKYSYRGALESIANTASDNTNGGYFCSHLIASIYSDAGLSLLNKPIYKITPNDLMKSSYLRDVTEQVISPYSEVTLQRVKNKGEQINCIDAGGGTLSVDAKKHQEFLRKTSKYFIQKNLTPPSRSGDLPEILTNPKNLHLASKLDSQLAKKYKEIRINENIRSSMIGVDFESDLSTLMTEIELHGYDYARETYSALNYLLITSSIKYLNTETHKEHFLLFYKEWRFQYFELKVEYYSIILEMISNIMEFYLDAIKSIENKYLEYCDELTQIKMETVLFSIHKQADAEKIKQLLEFYERIASS